MKPPTEGGGDTKRDDAIRDLAIDLERVTEIVGDLVAAASTCSSAAQLEVWRKRAQDVVQQLERLARRSTAIAKPRVLRRATRTDSL